MGIGIGDGEIKCQIFFWQLTNEKSDGKISFAIGNYN